MDTLLVELLTEELPPRALSRLGEVFAAEIHAGLVARQLTTKTTFEWFATPRRLAVRIGEVLEKAPDARVTEKIMPTAIAFDREAAPSMALLKKLEAKGIPISEIPHFEKRQDGKAEALFYTMTMAGASLDAVLAGIVAESIKKLPIPKVMRWGSSHHQFVRPVHGLIMLHGERIVPGEVLGFASGRKTCGHRFLASAPVLEIASAASYETTLKTEGKVIASFDERRTRIAAALAREASALGSSLSPSDALLNEVTALVEWPSVYVGQFDPVFLDVPQECLILTMQQHQKYFPLFDAEKKLRPQFLIVSNMEVKDPTHIISGNARVVRPRLADARFFYTQDQKQTLASRVDKLNTVVYHNKLGTLGERVSRLACLAEKIAHHIGAEPAAARRAAELAKADLLTDMVGEFPELQGTMGRYYALHDGEAPVVADAIQTHYYPRFAGDALPVGKVACAVALADKLDALVGFFGIGLLPTGDKDPFGLRRAALGVLRILKETPLAVSLITLLQDAIAGFAAGVLTEPVREPLFDFMIERLRGLLREEGYAQDLVDAVIAGRPVAMDGVPAKLEALSVFVKLPEAQALAAANKRITNLLKKAAVSIPPRPDPHYFEEAAEKALFTRIEAISPVIAGYIAKGAYTEALMALAAVRPEVDAFFDAVMVNVERPEIRMNRLSLLAALLHELNAVADISRLSV